MKKKMIKLENQQPKMEKCQEKGVNKSLSRRSFLKKSAYSAPMIMALGQLVKPSDAQAGYSVPPPPVW